MGCAASKEFQDPQHVAVATGMSRQWQQRFEAELAAARAHVPMLQVINNTRVTLDDMDDIIFGLHAGFPSELKSKPLRLIRVDKLLKWSKLKCYEQVEPEDCLEIPYSETTDDLWHSSAVVSWRWNGSKPQVMNTEFSPMHDMQMLRLQVLLHEAKESGIAYVWIDWSCVPQYGESPMTEVLRSKLFYARARIQIVIPQFKPLPEGLVSVLLHNVVRAAKRQHDNANMEDDMGLAIITLAMLLKRGEVAGREYFGRVWTLAERLARCGRKEKLNQWMPLDVWLGMVVDALLNSDKDRSAADIYWSKLIPARLRQQLDSAMDKLKVAIAKKSVQPEAAKGLEVELMAVFEGAVEAWRTSSMAEVPNAEWLKLYLTKEAVKVYEAFDFRDLVWAVYSYFVWETRDMKSVSVVQEALQDLCKVVEIECAETTIHAMLEQAAEKERIEEERRQQEERVEKERLEKEQAEKRQAEMQRLAEEQAQKERAAKELELKRQAEILAEEQKQRAAKEELENARRQMERQRAEVAAEMERLKQEREELARAQASQFASSVLAPLPARNVVALDPLPALATKQVSGGPSLLSQMIKSKEAKLTCAATWKPHEDTVWCLALSRDGATLVSTSLDKTLAVCDAATGRLSCTLQGHTDVVSCVVLTPDGRSVISGSPDETIRVWNLAPSSSSPPAGQGSGGGAAMTVVGAPQVTTTEGEVVSMALSGDGRLLATGHNSPDHILLWRVELQQHTSQNDQHTGGSSGSGGVVLRRHDGCGPLTGHLDGVACLVMTCDGKTLVSGSADKTMRMWSLPQGQCLRTIEGHSHLVIGLALTLDEAILVSASYEQDNTVRLWQLSSGAQLACIKGSFRVAVSPDGSTLVSCSEDLKQVAVWDLAAIMLDPAAHHQHRTITTECDEDPAAFAIAPDGSCFFSGHAGGSVRLWRPTLP